MNTDADEVEVFFERTDGSSYIESLVRSRYVMSKTNAINILLAPAIEEVILMELELAKMGAEKAKSEVLKSAAKEKGNLRPIK